MRGYLQKTEEGWFVIYDQRTMQDPSAEDGKLPLHPKNASFLDMNLTSTTFFNKEIEFEEINLVDKLDSYQNCVFKTYAQFITTDNHIVDTNEMVSVVEWFYQTIIKDPLGDWDYYFKQAKAMHKVEIINANWEASEDTDRAEQYYTKTFK